MSWGFYQLPMEPKIQNYTAFSTPFGSFKWLRMPMGLTGSPNTFQRSNGTRTCWTHMEHYSTYLDDCIIFSKTPEEHIKRLQQVFQRFREANLKINPTKCAFFQTKVQFLGHVISKDGLEADRKESKQFKIFQYHKTKQMLSRF